MALNVMKQCNAEGGGGRLTGASKVAGSKVQKRPSKGFGQTPVIL
jgi:hypothetical protein